MISGKIFYNIKRTLFPTNILFVEDIDDIQIVQGRTIVVMSYLNSLYRVDNKYNPYTIKYDKEYIIEAYTDSKYHYLHGIDKKYLSIIENQIDVLDIVSSQNIIIHATRAKNICILEIYRTYSVFSIVNNRNLIDKKKIYIGINDISYYLAQELQIHCDTAEQIIKQIQYKGDYYDYKQKIYINDLEFTKSQVIFLLNNAIGDIFCNITVQSKYIVFYSPYISNIIPIIKTIYPKHYILSIELNDGISSYMKNFYKQKMQLIHKDKSFIDKFLFWFGYNI